MDTLKQFTPEPALDIWSYFFGFIKTYYLENPGFWASILLVFLIMYILRVLVFDNKGIKWNARSWFYPITMIAVIMFVVWLRNEVSFAFSKKYISDFLTTAGAVTLLYMAFGHKLLAKLSELTPFLKDAEKPVQPPSSDPGPYDNMR